MPTIDSTSQFDPEFKVPLPLGVGDEFDVTGPLSEDAQGPDTRVFVMISQGRGKSRAIAKGGCGTWDDASKRWTVKVRVQMGVFKSGRALATPLSVQYGSGQPTGFETYSWSEEIKLT